MSFRVSARTMLQLGAELISSDTIAFYELIKNSFDAESPRVDIDVVVRIDHQVCATQREFINGLKDARPETATEGNAIEKCQEALNSGLDSSAPHSGDLRKRINSAKSWDDLLEIVDDANYILIEDTGTGMSLEDLEDVYLTIGTYFRLDQRNQKSGPQSGSNNGTRPVLGQKGIGRLSAMRLGWNLRLDTTEKGETRWNLLEIDWRRFDAPELLIGDIEIHPVIGTKKIESGYSGTRIEISALTSSWSSEKLLDVAKEFSKLTNPFIRDSIYPISLRFNENPITIPRLDRILFEQSHAVVTAEFTVDAEEPHFSGTINYSLRSRQKSFSLGRSELFSTTDKTPISTLKSLGPFSVELYWFNRRILTEVDGIGTRKKVLDLVNEWSGGLMLFRDGFRVFPYGGPQDDWIDLDRKALSSQGYKVNRKQIIGQVRISLLENPSLIDQTNREGLRVCPEKDALVLLLKHLLEDQFRTFITNVDKEIQAREPVTFDDLEERALNEEREMLYYLEALLEKYPELRKDRQVIKPIEDSIGKIRLMLHEASEIAESYKKGQTELLNLASLGLMVEIVAHELNRSTIYALKILGDVEANGTTSNRTVQFETLEAQLKTLQKRLRILDPLSTAGRQTKAKFDLTEWIDEILQSHQAEFDRHGIKYTLVVQPASSARRMPVQMVKGMVVQVMENLLLNSVYWLKQQKELDRSFKPEIVITLDTEVKEIRVTDNGPGVDPNRQEEIFQAFVTSKPPGEGKGLGLYISREIVKYHNATIAMSEDRIVHSDRLNTFVVSLEVGE